MRLPTDAVLLFGQGADALVELWRQEQLPMLAIGSDLGARLEAIPTATVVACGAGAREAATLAAALGYRTFLIGEGPAPEGARAATLADAIEAGRAARARERWKAARAGST